MRQLFLDMDGVLADFDAQYERHFGVRPDRVADNVDWKAIRSIPNFYRDIPPMPDLAELWDYTKRFNPIVLTGIPFSVEEAESNKREWAEQHLPGVHVICCLSKNKSLHMKPGDILVDDWEKYKDVWVQRGGVWITHTSAANTIEQLKVYENELAVVPTPEGV